MTRSAGPRPVPSDLPPTLQPMAITHAAPRTDKRVAMLGAMAIYGCMPLAMMAMGSLIPKIELKAPEKTHHDEVIYDFKLGDLAPAGGRMAAVAPAIPAPPQAMTSQVAPLPPQVIDDVNVEPPKGLPTGPSTSSLTADPHAQQIGPVGPASNDSKIGPSMPGSGEGDARVVDFTATGLQVLKQVDPIYPPVARASHTQGSVVLRMVVDERGYPTKADVIEGPPLLRAEALRAAQQWQFVPARVGGQPVAATFLLTLKFRLI